MSLTGRALTKRMQTVCRIMPIQRGDHAEMRLTRRGAMPQKTPLGGAKGNTIRR